ncbi:hypothetical protein EV644_108195 [Kribbella orskensis]|uniref:Uncharacterized protein n=1 Tax=Kribbella orskensis TaxID=2512216 RepID=A0ABY2BKM9_9ACTN|nr:hypothetical protein EV642_108195 [Kribbella sp. VKM Ac-2500]TCO20981.1 hypothetical protein EV644_108195 [Kribbella orskensis]
MARAWSVPSTTSACWAGLVRDQPRAQVRRRVGRVDPGVAQPAEPDLPLDLADRHLGGSPAYRFQRLHVLVETQGALECPAGGFGEQGPLQCPGGRVGAGDLGRLAVREVLGPLVAAEVHHLQQPGIAARRATDDGVQDPGDEGRGLIHPHLSRDVIAVPVVRLFAEGLLELVEHLSGRADHPAVPGVGVLTVPEFVREDRDPLLRPEAGPERQADTDHRTEAPADPGEPDVRLRVDRHGCDRLGPDGLGDLVQQREQGGCLLAVQEVGVRVQPVGAGTEEDRHAERHHGQRDAEPERAVEGQQGDTAEKADQGKKEDYCRQQVCPEPGGVPAGAVDAAALEFAVQGVGEPLLEPLSPEGLVGFSRRRIDVPVALFAPGDVAPVRRICWAHWGQRVTPSWVCTGAVWHHFGLVGWGWLPGIWLVRILDGAVSGGSA